MSILALLELQQSLLKSLKEWGDFTGQVMKTQMTVGEAAADDLLSSAEANGISMIGAGITSLAGAAFSLYSLRSATKESMQGIKEMGEAEKQLKPVNTKVEALEKAKDPAALKQSSQKKLTTKEVKTLKARLERLKSSGDNQEWSAEDLRMLEQAKNLPDTPKNAPARKAYEDLKTHWEGRQKTLETKKNTASNKVNTEQTKQNQKIQTVSSFVGAVSTLAQGSGQIAKGAYDKENQIEQTISQQESSIANQAAQAREQSTQNANNVNNVINKIKSSELQA